MKSPFPPISAWQRKAAFTLLEAMLAVFIFSMAVVALVEAVNHMGKSSLISRQERQLQIRMDALLLEATRSPDLFSGVNLEPTEKKTIEEDGVRYTVEIKPIEMKTYEDVDVTGIFSVEVIAQWKEGLEDQEARAATWVYPPLFRTRP